MHPRAVSNAVTLGIRVSVTTAYLPTRSSPAGREYVFAYTVRIANEGTVTAQLRTRHWIITDGDGQEQHVQGDGVVGAQPLLRPGEHFEYTSGAVLETSVGTMQGSYGMLADDGTRFEAPIPAFTLAVPRTLH